MKSERSSNYSSPVTAAENADCCDCLTPGLLLKCEISFKEEPEKAIKTETIDFEESEDSKTVNPSISHYLTIDE